MNAGLIDHIIFAPGRISVPCHVPGCIWPLQPHVCGLVYSCEEHCPVCGEKVEK